MCATAEFNGDFLPFFVVDVFEYGFEGDADADNADGVGVFFFKDSADASDCFGNMEGHVLAVDEDVAVDVFGANIFNL